MEDQEIQNVLESGEIFDFRPSALIEDLGLLNPKGWSYRQASTYGHFGRDIFPWEQLDKVDALRGRFNLNVVK